jgi:phosphomannomutase
MSIYKPCDIRGNATDELSPALYAGWGRVLGRQLPAMAKFVVGGDVRTSTPAFLTALADGLCQTGLDVVNVGLLPTPMVYYAQQRLDADGCAIVTASHNPANMNGLKWLVHDRPPTPDEVAVMAGGAMQPELGSAVKQKVVSGNGRCPTTPRTLDISFDYVASLQERFVDVIGAQLHVVLDPMHGCWAEKARRYLHAIFPQCLFSTISDTVDGQFGGREPDCSQARALTGLCDAVYRERADLGIAFDGDGDRIAVVDNEGAALTPEETVSVLLNAFADELPGERFVYDQKFSDRIPESARRLGAEPLVERSGHTFLRARMRESNALFGAEQSGHYFFRSLHGAEDALYTACLLIEHLSRSEQRFSALRRTCPPVYMTPDLRLFVPLDEQPRIMDGVRAAWSQFPQRTLDGVRIDLPGGWALVRRSVTEPALTFRFEGLDWSALENLVERFCDALPDWGDEVWMRYRAALGHEGAG